MERTSRGFLHESALTRYAATLSVCAIAASTLFLFWRYPSLPDILPVHFGPKGGPNGWQFRTMPRVFVPVFVQLGIFLASTSIGLLLLSRKDAETATSLPDGRAAVTATEAIALMSTTWVVVQAYTAYALVRLWSGVGSTLGIGYTAVEVAAAIVTDRHRVSRSAKTRPTRSAAVHSGALASRSAVLQRRGSGALRADA